MKKATVNTNQNNFLKGGFKDDISKHHKASLGITVPEGYFSKSKRSIIDKIEEEVVTEVPTTSAISLSVQCSVANLKIRSLSSL